MNDKHTMALEGAKILVTGGDGFIGANLVRALLDMGLTVDAMVTRPDKPKRLAGMAGERRLSLVAWDLAQNPAELVEQQGYDLIFHLAAIMPDRDKDALRILTVNTVASLELAKAMAARGGFMVFAGTVSEYSGQAGVLAEDDPPSPGTLYGVSKAAAVMAIKSLVPVRAWCVTRLFGVYGPHEARQRLLPYITGQLTRGEPALLTQGDQIRDFIHVADAARAMIAAAALPASRGRVYNIGSGVGRSVRDVAALAGQHLGRPELLRFGAIPSRSAAPDNFIADVRRAAKELGWRARIGIAEGVARTVDWFKDERHV
jgi:nucleoside-diphosphate-sugar epimerase